MFSGLFVVLRPYAFFAFVVLILYYFIKKSGSQNTRDYDDFFAREREANLSRKRDIPQELFYSPDISLLPVREYGDECNISLAQAQAKALKRAEGKMLQFPRPMTNTELKMLYGPANLENIINYEQNFDNYARALNKWAAELIEEGFAEEGEAVFKAAADMGSMFFETYSSLIRIYAKRGDETRLRALLESISGKEAIANDTFLKNKIEAAAREALLH